MFMAYGVIYGIENRINHKIYVGQTTRLKSVSNNIVAQIPIWVAQFVNMAKKIL